LALTAAVGVWLSGCSTDATRFSDNSDSPFSNPFATASNDAAAPTSAVASTPLAPSPQYAAAPAPVAVAAAPPPAEPAAPARVKPGLAAGWSPVGGTPIVVAKGDNLDALSRRYGVPPAAMLKANGLASPADVHDGMHLIVPVYNANGAPPTADKAKRLAAADSSDADVAPIKRDKAKKPARDVADATPPAKKPAKDAKNAAPADAPRVATSDVPKSPAKGAPAPDSTPTSSVRPSEPPAAAPLTGAQADAQGVAPEFRWPARGRIIEGFKVDGNDGINIAVPEGTSVRAAESGVVIYSGSGLKGYGNIVLIRHPNGFVSAYANNAELEVKNGDTVKRGQIIAKSGQTGNVNSPQLHFELRKGQTPVDPTSYLAGL
jgi:murein DD-endopeptidase MepM/ murein hydrolase activator NlpD